MNMKETILTGCSRLDVGREDGEPRISKVLSWKTNEMVENKLI